MPEALSVAKVITVRVEEEGLWHGTVSGNPRFSLSFNFILPSVIVLLVTHHGNLPVMTPKAGRH